MLLENYLNKKLYYFLGVIIFMFITYTLYIFFFREDVVISFKITHFLFNYEDEFLKRAFVGEILRIINFDITNESIILISKITLIAITVIFVLMAYLFWKNSPKDTGSLLFISLFLFSSPTLMFFYHDMGRFDIYGLIIALISIFLILNTKPIVYFIIVPVLMVIIILIHEGMFFMFIPLILGFMLYKTSNKKHYITIAIIAMLQLYATYIISTKGQATYQSYEEHYEKLVSKYGENMVGSSLEVLYKGGLIENIKNTIENGFTKKRIMRHIKFCIFLLIPLLYLFYQIFKDSGYKWNDKRIIIFLMAFSPLALYPLGHDHFRWWAIALNNAFIVILILSIYDSKIKKSVVNIMYNKQNIVLFLLIISAIFGGVGVTSPFHR